MKWVAVRAVSSSNLFSTFPAANNRKTISISPLLTEPVLEQMRITDVDAATLIKIWPKKRLVAGLRVGKWIRDLLLRHAERGLLRHRLGKRPNAKGIAVLLANLQNPNSKLDVQMDCCSSPSVLCDFAEEIDAARRGGWEGGLEALSLTNSSIDQFWNPQDSALALAFLCQQFPSLTRLDLNSMWIGSSGIKALCWGLQSCTRLAVLRLRKNDIQKESAVALSSSLSSCSELMHLDLGSNSIETSGAVALSQALVHLRKLRHLDVSANKIGCIGGNQLGNAFAQGVHTALTHLDLSLNSLEGQGAQCVLAGVRHLPALRYFNLRKVVIDGAMVQSVTADISQCTTLTQLDLRDNGLSWEEASQLGGNMQAAGNTCLKELKVFSPRSSDWIPAEEEDQDSARSKVGYMVGRSGWGSLAGPWENTMETECDEPMLLATDGDPAFSVRHYAESAPCELEEDMQVERLSDRTWEENTNLVQVSESEDTEQDGIIDGEGIERGECEECGAVAPGATDATDGLFYCVECWDAFEQRLMMT